MTVAVPLTNLLKVKLSSLKLNSIGVKVFQNPKDQLTTAPIFKVYNPILPIRV